MEVVEVLICDPRKRTKGSFSPGLVRTQQAPALSVSS